MGHIAAARERERERASVFECNYERNGAAQPAVHPRGGPPNMEARGQGWVNVFAREGGSVASHVTECI